MRDVQPTVDWWEGFQPPVPTVDDMLASYERQVADEAAEIRERIARQDAAVKARNRDSLLGPGECGGESCPMEWEQRMLESVGPGGGGSMKKHPDRQCGGGHRVIRKTNTF